MTQLDSKTKALFKDPIKRRAWVKYQVHLQGRSMAQVAADAGVRRATLYQTFIRPYPRMEKIIADAVGLTPQVLFAERYDADGLPNRTRGRRCLSTTKKAKTKHNTRPADRNVNHQEAA